ncbi:MAG: hypothetical protein H6742_20475 [Alphaproteobacteria bacterium]|nr:hypothetical protein [Alphaproteobacteria bacterium]
MTPTGDVRVLLTSTGQEPQRVVLQPDGDGWAGAASAAGAAGYIAVISTEVEGATWSGRASWGDVTEVTPAPKPPPPPYEEDDDGHGHGH